jgi:1-acyl-sn-glycerol-3-phosphate acyltransferase
MERIKRIIFSGFAYLYSAMVLVVMIVITFLTMVLTRPFDSKGRILNKISSLYGALFIWGNPMWSIKISGKENIPVDGAYILISNHQSMTDIMALYSTFIHFKWVSKRENFKIPFVGWVLTMNQDIRLARSNPRSMIKMMNQCVCALGKGIPVLLFPEGTRSRNGKLRNFKEGAFKIAKKAGVPIVPVVLDNTWKATIDKNGLLKEKADIKMCIFPARKYEDFKELSERELAKSLQAFYSETLEEWRSSDVEK